MAEIDRAQIYLITPPTPEASVFPDQLAQVLDTVDVACVRLALAFQGEDDIARVADACRAVTHDRDVALVVQDHVQLVQRLGLDGVHLSQGARGIRAARKELGDDAIVGCFSGASRHDGLNAGEASADYVCFGPVASTLLGDGSLADEELFAWWSEMIEVPVIAEGGLDTAMIRTLADKVDFFGIGSEIWDTPNPTTTIAALAAARD